MSGVKIYDLREKPLYSLIIEGTPIKVEKFGDELIIHLDTGYKIHLSAYTLNLIKTALQPNEREAVEDSPPFVEPGTGIPEAIE